MTNQPLSRTQESVLGNRSFWGAFLVGVGVAAGVDEIVFHQILAWHHFYDSSTPDIGLLSDGLLHAAELFAIVAGFFLLLDARRRLTFWTGAAWSGFFVGLGLFQLWDGIVNHKVLGLHQIRYGVDIAPYDISWNIAGLVLLAVGVILAVLLSRRGQRAPVIPPA